jgi:LAO/AO transport system kinase
MQMKDTLSQEVFHWIRDAKAGEKFPLARLISLIEKPDSSRIRRSLFAELEQYPRPKSITIGFTGTPGAGKSSLISEICKEFLYKNTDKKIAIVAIDPSSSISGGSILGDRTRLNIPARENRIYFRSQASQLELGGINPYTYHVIRLLRYFFDFVFIETVGIGQNEIEVSKLVDYSFLILQPFAGDNIQFMKSGIMEVPDAFILNKCDEKELAMSSYHMLINSLEFLKDILNQDTMPKIFQTSTVKKIGIIDLLDYILEIPPKLDPKMETFGQIQKWVKNEFGKWGLRELEKINQYDSLLYEDLEDRFLAQIQKRILS